MGGSFLVRSAAATAHTEGLHVSGRDDRRRSQPTGTHRLDRRGRPPIRNQIVMPARPDSRSRTVDGAPTEAYHPPLMSAARDVEARSVRVQVAVAHRLTLVVAAPGWGKTTLLRSFGGAAPTIEVARPPTGWTPLSLARQSRRCAHPVGRERRPPAGAPRPRLGRPPRPEHRAGGRRLHRRRRGGGRGHDPRARRRRRRGGRPASRLPRGPRDAPAAAPAPRAGGTARPVAAHRPAAAANGEVARIGEADLAIGAADVDGSMPMVARRSTPSPRPRPDGRWRCGWRPRCCGAAVPLTTTPSSTACSSARPSCSSTSPRRCSPRPRTPSGISWRWPPTSPSSMPRS